MHRHTCECVAAMLPESTDVGREDKSKPADGARADGLHLKNSSIKIGQQNAEVCSIRPLQLLEACLLVSVPVARL